MAIGISTPVHNKQTLAGLNNFEKKQYPYAVARALASIATTAKERVKRDLKKHFKIRSGWTAKGIRTTRADKNDLKKLDSLRRRSMTWTPT